MLVFKDNLFIVSFVSHSLTLFVDVAKEYFYMYAIQAYVLYTSKSEIHFFGRITGFLMIMIIVIIVFVFMVVM